MSTRTKLTAAQRAVAAVVAATTLTLIVVVGMVLREHGPGNMGTGFLQGALVGVVAFAVMAVRAARRPERATTFERAWTQQGDERDDAVLTRALAVVGISAFPATAFAGVAMALGAPVEVVVTLLLGTEIAVFAVAFAVVSRRM